MVTPTTERQIQKTNLPTVTDQEMIAVAEKASQLPPPSTAFQTDTYSAMDPSSALPTFSTAPSGFSPVLNPQGYIRPAEGPITSGFGTRESPGGIGSTDHKGIDIGAPIGTPIWAARDGTVVSSGWQQGYGNTVEVKHDDGNTTLYAHASELLVTEGQQVKQGQEIAKVGSTGNSTGPHLHFGIKNSAEEFFDPSPIVNS